MCGGEDTAAGRGGGGGGGGGGLWRNSCAQALERIMHFSEL